MKHLKHIIPSAVALLLPVSVFAQNYSSGSGSLSQISNANDIVDKIAGFADTAVYLLVALAVLYIVYSTVMYFIKGKEGDEHRKEAGMQILWGIVGLFIIVSIWGLVNILINTFPTGDNSVPTDRLPSANFVNSGSNSTDSFNQSQSGISTPPDDR